MALTALRVFNRFVIVALLALVACLGMCLTGTAWAQCSIIPVAPPPLSANFSGLTFTPASPYFLGFAGLVGCEGAEGDSDDDGMPGFAGQPAAQVAGTSSGLTIIGAPSPPVTFAPTTAALISAIGGGGGTGGEAGVPIFSPTNGGTGGAGGAGQAITVAFSGNFVPDPATGLGSTALLAQSFGGPGGGGGGTHTFDSGGKFGGDGGVGGAGGPVSLTASGTASALSLGVAGVSVGGFGGAGSDASSSADVLSTATGGNGGNGGAGGDVAVQWTGGAITTQSQGINAFSAGGEAGSGGAATSATGLQGGNGATGGTAGAASAILAAGSVAITLDPPTGPVDSVSFGVAAQSLGGPGGDGGLAGASLGSGGGNGGNGGAGGPASVTILGAVTYGVTGALPTDPVSGYALLVQSNGGIGGNGAGASGLAGEAGGGGFAGTGGRADLTLGDTSGTAAIRSAGNHAHGALVQSVGGGGGNGGQANFAIGGGSAGSGQAGGNGGAVNIAAPAASVIASGPNSAIMVAQSIGGGGGTGGDIQNITVAASIAIGGNGGLGGNGGAVDVTLGSGIFGSTSTIGGAGVLAQSIGGSGGVAGSASATGTGLLSLTIGGDAGGGGLGGPVTIANGGLVTTYGDHAAGIQAQSIGGGGGKGGSAVTFIAGALPTAAVAVGGRGGSGGPAGEVAVANTAQVTTYGPDAAGILLQSVGGGGGSGGASAARAVALSPDKRIPAISIAVAIGGKGGSGNIGGTVRLDNSGLITTAGHGAYGVLAQSIGGGGGTGGDSTAAAYSGGNTGDGIAISIATAVGGGGGTGALGGAVTLNNAGLILTLGQDAYGVFAQSIGGGGGTGGGGDASAASNEAKFSFSTSIGVGGSGGSGGTANTVGLTNTGSITTRGDGSDGVFAQSIGGGGGTAGGGTATASGGTISVAVGVGGTGGAGGDGRAVAIANAGGIVTRGADSVGIFAQSIGGGGGKGGKGAATAGGVTTLSNVQALYDTLAAGLNFNQSVTTVADFILQIGQIGENIKSQIDELKGILAQPQAPAGGGEDGQGSKIDIQVNVGTAVAGKGGGGGQGGPVNTSNTGQVITFGAQSDGILAQSVGGGGGKGGAASSVGAASDDTPVQTTVSVGGGGGAAGGGGAVSVDNGKGGAILTQGVLAMGVVAQSIGGGGGVGSVAGTVDGSLKSLGVGLGGSGGAGGAGGAVTVTTGDGTAASSIATTGKHGIAILAQSIGGGGGLAKTMTTDQTFDPAKILNNPQGRVADIQGLSVDLGGQGGAAGDGGPVAVNASGPVTTLGLGAHGIAAQSIGAGGGLVAGGQFLGPIHVGGPVGGVGGGGPVAIQLQAGAAIATSGDGAYGLLAQSIGGGGGVAGDPSVGATASGSAFTSPVTTYVRDIPASVRTPGIGNGGDVSISLANASIRTSGVYAPAVFAQTVGGGGGLIVQKTSDTARTIYRGSSGSGGTAGQIRVDLKSSIVAATGIGSAGILAQATGTATGAIMITLDTSSAVQGGTPDPNAGGQSPEQRDSAAIRILGGTGNTIVNDGAITANLSGGTRGYAILADSDRVTVTNAGTIVGDIKTGAFGQLDNLAGGIIAAPRAIDVGGGTVRNAGALQPGGAGLIGMTTINGDYVQSATGTLVVDIAANGPDADRLLVNGRAEIGGTITPAIGSGSTPKPGMRDVAVVTATGGLRVAAASASASPVVTARLAASDARTATLRVNVDYSGSDALQSQGLGSSNRGETGRALNAVLAADTGALSPFAARLIGMTSARALATTLDLLSAEVIADAKQSMFVMHQTYASTVMQRARGMDCLPSLAGSDIARTACPASRPDGLRVWGGGFGGSDTLRGREGRGTLHTQFGGGVIGLDKWFGDRAMVGVSVGGGTANLGVSGRSSDGRIGSFALGVYGQVRFGDAYVAGLVSYGNFQTDLRRAAIPDPSAPFAAGRGSTGGNVVGGRVELGWRRHLGTLSLTPFAALEVDHIWQRPMTESTTGGSGGLAIRYAGSEATSVPLTLGGRIGGAVPLGEGRFLALSAELGWTHEFNPTRAVTASFVSAPGVPFRIKGASAAVDSAVGAFDARLAVTSGVALLARVGGRVSAVGAGISGFGGVQVTW